LSSEQVILIGDFNARIGECQNLSGECFLNTNDVKPSRSSRDTFMDSRGSQFIDMCNNYGLIVINGRCDADWRGEFTYVSGRGRSVIDLCCVSLAILPLIRSFHIIAEVFSDHLPIVCYIEDEGRRRPKETDFLRETRLKWRDDNLNKYRGLVKGSSKAEGSS